MRSYGRTGAKVTVIALGWCGLGFSSVSQAEANKMITLAMDYGVNMIDVAPSYGDAEV